MTTPQSTQAVITIVLARVLSAYLSVSGLGFLLSGDYFAKVIAHLGSDPVLINLSGMVYFLIGMTIVVVHFHWKKSPQFVVSAHGIAPRP